MRTLLLTFLVTCTIATSQTGQLPRRTVRASAEAMVSGKPDRAEIRIGVVTNGATAQAASAENARETSDVMSSMKTVLAGKGELKTSSYSITPQYQYGNNTKPKLTGYQASNIVSVTVDDMSILSTVIDKSVANGANDVNGISFSLRDDQALRRQALSEAARKAKASAEALAAAVGAEVTGVVDVEVADAPSRMVQPMMAMARNMEAPPTPVEAGNIEVRASVTVTLEIK